MRRDTVQRRAIRRVFEDRGHPMSPEDVLSAGQALVPSLGIATVYRNIKSLVEEGWLQTVELPGEAARYELSRRPHHHHFLCRGCGLAYDIHACPEDVEGMAPKGFVVENHEVLLYGRCPDCS